jgi:hypothetical protein
MPQSYCVGKPAIVQPLGSKKAPPEDQDGSNSTTDLEFVSLSSVKCRLTDQRHPLVSRPMRSRNLSCIRHS